MNKSIVYGLGLITMLAVCLYLVVSMNRLQKQVDKLKNQQTFTTAHSEEDEEDGETGEKEKDDDEEVELAIYMNRLQLYTNKLWFAAKNKNWELASFYLEEAEETMEEVAEDDIVEDGIRINEQMKTWGIPAIEPLEKAIESKDLKNVELEYTNLITNCNGCHTATKHSFIKIKIPDTPAFTNQVY
ncbi:MAG: hypothetical protein N2167_07895 [Flavobacteriales bacterium]|nr:hypothetical protein [Flavobacteriales bacterium]